MKVAILSPVAWRTPPRHYGPWEQVASNITEGLVERGVDVTLFATKDSLTKGKLDGIIERGYEEDKEIDPKVAECLHIGLSDGKSFRIRPHSQPLRFSAPHLLAIDKNTDGDNHTWLFVAQNHPRL